MATLEELSVRLDRIEHKLDLLIQALADEVDDDTPIMTIMTLDGDQMGAQRAEHTPL